MQKDFHYYCIGVLAKAAGFQENDALIIAYASQYVDNATESEPIQVGEMIFDPVRTAHIGLSSYKWSIQKRVYIPFHFIPPKPLKNKDDTFITEPNSQFAMMVWDEAEKEDDRQLRLYRMGIALHTFADTWAHQGFSGRRNDENDVENIHIHDGHKWNHLKWENIYLDVLPQIGHAEAGHFPDQSYLVWKYKKRDRARRTVERDNVMEFSEAAKKIYDLLAAAAGPNPDRPVPWAEIEPRIRDRFKDAEEDLNKRCTDWLEEFDDLLDRRKFGYDPLKWRDEAFSPKRRKDIIWDDFDPSDFKRLRFRMKPGFYDEPWVKFHRAALKQRHFVLENLL